jgi:hypothetical protein
MVHDSTTNHAGYSNESSNDSWVEGFASWFATELRLADGRPSAYYKWGGATTGAKHALEPNLKPWGAEGKDEEWAVAGLLLDLTDGGAGDAGQEIESTVEPIGLGHAMVRGLAPGAHPDRDLVVVEL